MSFRDHFSKVALGYAAYRPHYPDALFDFLAEHAPGRSLAWDCACGNGQATLDLAERFEHVIGTDPSEAQIAQAPPHPRIEWRVAPGEQSGLPDATCDLVTVAQALHWLDIDAFFREAASRRPARRASSPCGRTVTCGSTSPKSIASLGTLRARRWDRTGRPSAASSMTPTGRSRCRSTRSMSRRSTCTIAGRSSSSWATSAPGRRRRDIAMR